MKLKSKLMDYFPFPIQTNKRKLGLPFILAKLLYNYRKCNLISLQNTYYLVLRDRIQCCFSKVKMTWIICKLYWAIQTTLCNKYIKFQSKTQNTVHVAYLLTKEQRFICSKCLMQWYLLNYLAKFNFLILMIFFYKVTAFSFKQY